MTTTLQKWGNSQGIRLPKKALEELHLEVGDRVEVAQEGDRLVIIPIRQTKKYDIHELVAQIPEDYEPVEVDFAPSVGAEAW